MTKNKEKWWPPPDDDFLDLIEVAFLEEQIDGEQLHSAWQLVHARILDTRN